MKTLVNKANPQIRITAPEIRKNDGAFFIVESSTGYTLWGLMERNWTLVEEEPLKMEQILELAEAPLGRFTIKNLDKKTKYKYTDMQDAFLLGFKAAIEEGDSK